MTEIIFKDLSYKLTGIAYKIDNQIGFGHNEKIYSDAFEKILCDEKLSYKKEVYSPIKVDGHLIAKRYLDYLVEDLVVVEIKTGLYRYSDVFNQVFEYLKINNLKLGLVIRFGKTGVQVKRVINIRNS